ncbi:hypothetical protein TEQG_01765 [Trichophyton equinum CBS 127.97]|uniref:Uncharacterized protein n=1 Tax=Trichophyton equinum (strain ATCC MYA-4606 / CBS 127.97) TaxID=559882 RepID=F2PLD1_TRIEC|nr:hypothetical protein TEQG_01765 [Trichophyton equinum CBS 127.97]
MRLMRAGCLLGTLVPVPGAPRAASWGLPARLRQRYQLPAPARRSCSTTAVHRRAMATLTAAPLNPRHFPASGFIELDPAVPIEEEFLMICFDNLVVWCVVYTHSLSSVRHSQGPMASSSGISNLWIVFS